MISQAESQVFLHSVTDEKNKSLSHESSFEGNRSLFFFLFLKFHFGQPFHPLTPKSDWHLVSANHITPESNIKVTRIK